RASYFDLYVGDTAAWKRVTVDVGVRYDRQWGSADPSSTGANPAFPDLVPGIVFAGYRAPFTWNTFSPRASLTFALDESRKTMARVSYSSFAGQLSTQTVGAVNPAANLGSITFRWTDLDGDGFAQANEVNTSQILSTSGINLTDRSAVTSLSRIDPNLAPPRTRTIVAGVDRELMSNLVVQAAYTYSRTS